jgi:hypothetical protein
VSAKRLKTLWQETVAGNGSSSQTLVSKVPRLLVCRNRRKSA